MQRRVWTAVVWLLAACASPYWPTPAPRVPRTRLVAPPEFRLGVLEFSKDSTRPPETPAQAASCRDGSAPRPTPKVVEVPLEPPVKAAAPRGRKGARMPAAVAAPAAAPPREPQREEEPRPVCEPGIHEAEFTLAIPAMLAEELHDQGRFAVYSGTAFNETAAKEHVDGYLSGTVIKVSRDQVCFELRLANALSHELIYTGHACVPLEKDQQLRRDSMKRVAQDLGRAVGKVTNAQVTGTDGAIVYLNKGETAGVVRGMVAYVVGTAERASDATMLNAVKEYTGVGPSFVRGRTSPVIIGHLYILSTDDETSIGRLYEGDYAQAGDTVYFK
jgi:hypothetical protein